MPVITSNNRVIHNNNKIIENGSNTIKITISATAGFVAGINLTFASGTLTIDWKDGSVPENFVSGTEKLHTYVNAGTYIAEISGSLENITKFIADNCRITSISNLKTGLLTDFQIQSNLYSGELDMSLAPVSQKFHFYSNASLTSIKFATSGNAAFNSFSGFNCNLSTLDLSNNPVGGIFEVYGNSNLTSITFKTSGNNTVTYFDIHSNKLTGTLDLSNVPISTMFNTSSNSLLTSITFATSGNSNVSIFSAYSCNLSGALDLSNIPIGSAEGGLLFVQSNLNLTSITFASSGNLTIRYLRVDYCNLSNLDLSNIPIDTSTNGYVYTNNNSNLNSITFSSTGNGYLKELQLNACDFGYVNVSMFNTSIQSCRLWFFNNNMTAAEVNHILVDLDSIAGAGYTGRVIRIGGTNADPDSSSGGYDGLAAKTSLEGKGFTVTIT